MDRLIRTLAGGKPNKRKRGIARLPLLTQVHRWRVIVIMKLIIVCVHLYELSLDLRDYNISLSRQAING